MTVLFQVYLDDECLGTLVCFTGVATGLHFLFHEDFSGGGERGDRGKITQNWDPSIGCCFSKH